MALVFYKVNDPFALDLGLETIEKEFVANQSLSSYFPDKVFFNFDCEKVEESSIPNNGSSFIICEEVGWQIVYYIVYMIVAMIISMVMSAIFAPEPLNMSDDRPDYDTYFWGRGVTKSEAMIAVPIVFGKFSLFGNLIETSSETQTITQGTHTLYDNIHLLYGLCSNPLSSIESIYLNNADATDFDDQDLAVFYTLGDKDQGVIRAFAEDLNEDPNSNKVFRYKNLDNAPVRFGDLLFKDFKTEFYPDYALERGSHTKKSTTLAYTLVGEFQDKVTFKGVCDSSGQLLHPDLLPADHPYNSGGLYLLVTYKYSRKIKRIVDCSIEPNSTTDYFNYCGEYDVGTIADPKVEVIDLVEKIEPFPDSNQLLLLQGEAKINTYPDPLSFNTITEELYKYEDLVYGVKVGEVSPPTPEDEVLYIFKANSRSGNGAVIENGRIGVLAEVTAAPQVVEEGVWDTFHSTPGAPFIHMTQSNFGIEDVRLTFACPNGFFARRAHHTRGPTYHEVWVSFGFEITQYSGINVVADYKIEPLTLSGTNRPPKPSDAERKVPMYFCGKFLTSTVFDISIKEILDLENLYPNMEDFKGSTSTTTKLKVNSEGNLPARDANGKPYTYKVSVNMYSHGMKFNENGYQTYYQNPNLTDPTDFDQMSINLKIHRVVEINASESVTYPGTSLLAISLNATEALNNALPSIQCIVKSKSKIYPVEPDEEIKKYELSTWPEEYSANPAFLILSLLYDSFYGVGIGGTSLNPDKDQLFTRLVDIDKFIEFARYCDELIEINGFEEPVKRFEFHGVIDDKIITWNALVKILKSVDAVPIMLGNKISLTYERKMKEVEIPSMIFSDSEIIKGSLTQTFQALSEYTNSVSTTFFNEENFYEQTAANLNLSAVDTSSDTNKSLTIDCFGYTNPNRVYRRLIKAIRDANLGKKMYSFKTSYPALNLELGDIIGIQYELVDWPFTDKAVDVQVGRVDFIDEAQKLIILDYKFLTNQAPHYYILLKASDSDFYKSYLIQSTEIIGEKLKIVVDNGEDLSKFKAEDPYMVGAAMELYKEAVVMEIGVEKDGLFSIKASEYYPELFELNDYLITDFANLNYTKENLTPQNLTAIASNYAVVLSWAPPSICSSVDDEGTETKYEIPKSLKVTKYLIYRRSKEIINDHNLSNAEPYWNQVGEVPSDQLSFADQIDVSSFNFEYQVIPVFIFNQRFVHIPRSWCNIVSIKYSFLTDYLIAPIVKGWDTTFDSANGSFDIKLSIKPGIPLTLDVNEEFLSIWVAQKNSGNTDWLGPQHITLTQPCSVGDEYIYVSSIQGLPKCIDTGQVKGIFAINYVDEVYVNGNEGNRLKIANAKSSVPSSLGIGVDHSVGESFTSRHHGLFPVRAFATSADNNLVMDPNRESTTVDSLHIYFYELESNSNFIKTYSDFGPINGSIEQWHIDTTLLQAQHGWRVQNGLDRSVSYLNGVAVGSNDQLIFQHGKFALEGSDILLCTAAMTPDYFPVTIYPLFRGKNKFNIPPAMVDADGTLKIKIKNVSKLSQPFWVGVQYLILQDSFGYTSYIKVI